MRVVTLYYKTIQLSFCMLRSTNNLQKIKDGHHHEHTLYFQYYKSHYARIVQASTYLLAFLSLHESDRYDQYSAAMKRFEKMRYIAEYNGMEKNPSCENHTQLILKSGVV